MSHVAAVPIHGNNHDDNELTVSNRQQLAVKQTDPPHSGCSSPSQAAIGLIECSSKHQELSTVQTAPRESYDSHDAETSLQRPELSTPPNSSASSRQCPGQTPQLHDSDRAHFNVFNSLFNHSELVFEFAKQLPIDDLVSLYAISKDFHNLVNTRFTTMVLGHAAIHAPGSARTFPFTCYRKLCNFDPAGHPNEMIPGTIRHVPSLRWLRMLVFRERVVQSIIDSLAAEGHLLPPQASLTIKKCWLVLDIGDNKRRIGLLHNPQFWTDEDLYMATLFFFKLDMRMTDPVLGNGETGMREMLLAQRSLSVLARVLRREMLLTQIDALRMIVEWHYRPQPQHAHMSICGVPPHKIGALQWEGWGRRRVRLLRVDELVMMEAVRRNLCLQDHYIDMMLWGFVDKKTFQDMWHPGALDSDAEGEAAKNPCQEGGGGQEEEERKDNDDDDDHNNSDTDSDMDEDEEEETLSALLSDEEDWGGPDIGWGDRSSHDDDHDLAPPHLVDDDDSDNGLDLSGLM